MSSTGLKSNPERRIVTRASVEITSMLRTADRKLCGIVIDLTEQGMAVRLTDSLASNSLVDVWFSLPYSEHTVQCEGKVIWTDGMGRAGIQFMQLPNDARHKLADWLTQYTAKV